MLRRMSTSDSDPDPTGLRIGSHERTNERTNGADQDVALSGSFAERVRACQNDEIRGDEQARSVTRFCRSCEVWTNEPACFLCGGPGVDTRTDWRTVTARHWKNPATWTPEMEDSA